VLTQRKWRVLGAITLASSAAMVFYAARSGLLRQTVIAFTGLFNDKAKGMREAMPGGVLCLYWAIFCLLMCATMYMVFLDLRCLRRQYLQERRTMLRSTFGERTQTAVSKKEFENKN
jgi:hypothetical protein